MSRNFLHQSHTQTTQNHHTHGQRRGKENMDALLKEFAFVLKMTQKVREAIERDATETRELATV
jgi:hypothetical protein